MFRRSAPRIRHNISLHATARDQEEEIPNRNRAFRSELSSYGYQLEPSPRSVLFFYARLVKSKLFHWPSQEVAE